MYSERQRIMCPLGVLYINLQVSLMRMSPMKEIPCRVLMMRVHQYLYGERRHYPCPLGVLYTNLQVSLMQTSKFKLDSDQPYKLNRLITHINLAKGFQFTTRYNIQCSVQESRKREVFQVEQSAKPNPSLFCSQLLSLIGTSDNIYNQTTKHRDIFSLTSRFGKAGNISKPVGLHPHNTSLPRFDRMD